MKTLTLSDKEVDELIVFYEQELAKTESRLKEVKDILSQLNSDKEQREDSASRSPEQKPETAPEPKEVVRESRSESKDEKVQQPARNETAETDDEEEISFDISKLNWERFIESIVTNHNELITTAEIVDLAIQGYGLHSFKRIDISRKISPVLTKMVKAEILEKKRFKGYSGFYYGLPQWFDENGVPKEGYREKVSDSLPEPNEIRGKNQEKKDHDIDLWDEFITNSLLENKALLEVDDFVNKAQEKFDFSENDRKNYQIKISESLKRLFQQQQIRRMKPEGSEEYRYALPKWFKKNGELKKYYKK